MRLIDLNKMVTIHDEDNNAVIFGKLDTAEVEAIPVEWIRKWRKDKWFSNEPLEKRMIMAMNAENRPWKAD